jgi:uncharacterized protein YecE (DUF72 family)
MRGRLALGTSGFAFQEWKGIFYPKDLSSSRMLAFYAERFNSVEINYTYRRVPTEKAIRRWASQVPEGFLFTLKANMRITHIKRLRDVTTDVEEFVGLARLLGDRLGTILVQLPPTFKHDDALIRSFLDSLPEDVRFAMEFRHGSWAAARDLLAERGIGWVLTHTDDQPADPAALPGGPFVYLRLRREKYDDHEMRAWAASIADATEGGRDVFCYFKHEDETTGPSSEARLGELVGEVSRGIVTR